MDPRHSSTKSKKSSKASLQGRFTASNSQPTNRPQIQHQHHQNSHYTQPLPNYPQYSPQYPPQYPPQYSNYPQYSQIPTQFPTQFPIPDSPQNEQFSQFSSQPSYSNMLSQMNQQSYDEQLGYHQSVVHGNDDDDDEDAEVEIIPAFVAPTTKKARGKGKEMLVKLEGDKKAWETWEDQVLATCWCRYSETTFENTCTRYWGKITDAYNSEIRDRDGFPRNLKALQNRWGKIRKDSMKWIKAVKKARAMATSGASETTVQNNAEKIYAQENGVKFKLFHTLSILTKCEKFNTTTTSSLAFQLDQTNLNMTFPSPACDSSGSSKRSYDQFSGSQSEEVQSPMKPTAADFSVGHERPFGVQKMADLEKPGRKAFRDSKKKKKLQFADIPEESAVCSARKHELELERLRYRSLKEASAIKKRELDARTRSEDMQYLQMLQNAANTPEKEAAYYAQLEKFGQIWAQQRETAVNLRDPEDEDEDEYDLD